MLAIQDSAARLGILFPQDRLTAVHGCRPLNHDFWVIEQPAHKRQAVRPAPPQGAVHLDVVAGCLRLRQVAAMPDFQRLRMRIAAEDFGDIGIGTEAPAQCGRGRNPFALEDVGQGEFVEIGWVALCFGGEDFLCLIMIAGAQQFRTQRIAYLLIVVRVVRQLDEAQQTRTAVSGLISTVMWASSSCSASTALTACGVTVRSSVTRLRMQA